MSTSSADICQVRLKHNRESKVEMHLSRCSVKKIHSNVNNAVLKLLHGYKCNLDNNCNYINSLTLVTKMFSYELSKEPFVPCGLS